MKAMATRIDALEQYSRGPFAGFAPVDIWPGQTVVQAKAIWEGENGPVGNRRWLLWNFREASNASA